MRSPRLLFFACLLLSAAFHAALIWQLPRWARHAARPTASRPAYVVAPPGTVPELPPPERFGEADGTAKAINSSPGDRPQSAPESNPDQAAWTRDPAGRGPRRQPSEQPAERPAPKPMAQAVVAPPPAALPTPPESKLPTFRKPPPPQPQAPTADVERPPPPRANPRPPTEAQSEPHPPQPPSPAGGTPLPHSDQDSDPFAQEVTLEFTPGGVVASPGRQVKFHKPRQNLATFADSGEIAFPARLRLRIAVKPDGTPGRVDVITGTGSRSIDRAFFLAAYDSWFEPRKDKIGRPMADEFEFTIVLR